MGSKPWEELGYDSKLMFTSTQSLPRRAGLVGVAMRQALFPGVVAAVATFLLAYFGGAYGLTIRSALAIGIWLAIIVAVAVGVWPLGRIATGVVAADLLLAAFALLGLTSMAWAANPEGAFQEFDRSALYVGLFTVVALTVRRVDIASWSDGLAVGLVAIAVLALVSRFFPGVLPTRKLPEFLPDSATRLSFPVDYWNGLAILVGLALPLLLRAGAAAAVSYVRAAAVGCIPAIVAVIYLTSSRGGVLVALVGAVVVVLLARRWAVLGALAAATAGGIAAAFVLSGRGTLVNGPIDSPAAAHQGRIAAVLILLVCVATAAAYRVGERLLGARLRLSARAGYALVAAVVLLLVAGFALSHPGRRFQEFEQPPGQASFTQGNFTNQHLASGAGTGRWQFWTTAAAEFESAPWVGRGSGSFESWWAQHAPIDYFIKNAHSLYLQTLGELGIVGLLLLVGSFATALAVAVRGLRLAEGDERLTLAALIAAFVAYAVGAGLDWMWELTVVSVVGIACLAVAATAGGQIPARPRLVLEHEDGVRRRGGGRFGLALAVLVVGWLVIFAQAIPALSSHELQLSERSAAAGRGDDALDAAVTARRLQPWAASPYLQLALVYEQMNRLADAHRQIEQAIARDRDDWRPWLVEARIETKQGAIESARASLARARTLNPRSPLLAPASSS